MKIFKIIKSLIIFFLLLNVFRVYSQNPTYTLSVTNDTLSSTTTYDFDIYLLRTGTTSFEYANNSQYFININPAVINGGSLTFSIIAGTCGLNLIQQIPASRVSFDATNIRLRIAASSPSGAGTGTIISNTPPGTKLGRFRVANTVPFAAAQSNLTWYNFHSGFYTKVFAYVSTINTEVTDSTGHFININNSPLPIVISSFTSNVTLNNIELAWVTQSEINNMGFTVERNYKTKDTVWNSICFIKGNGTTNHPIKYSYTDIKLNAGTYRYRLKQTDYNNNIAIYQLPGDVVIREPNDISMSQNYPNPSNPKSKIDYQIPSNGIVSIKVYDLIGRVVATLVSEYKLAGYYSTEFDGSNLASGVYLYRLKTESYSETKKMVLVK